LVAVRGFVETRGHAGLLVSDRIWISLASLKRGHDVYKDHKYKSYEPPDCQWQSQNRPGRSRYTWRWTFLFSFTFGAVTKFSEVFTNLWCKAAWLLVLRVRSLGLLCHFDFGSIIFGPRELRTAIDTEPCSFSVVVFALWTAHGDLM
jgi:hypothetical protein